MYYIHCKFNRKLSDNSIALYELTAKRCLHGKRNYIKNVGMYCLTNVVCARIPDKILYLLWQHMIQAGPSSTVLCFTLQIKVVVLIAQLLCFMNRLGVGELGTEVFYTA